MPNSTIQSNFMPHEASSFTPKAGGKPPKGMSDLLMLFSIVIFVASAALAVGVFLYGEYLKQNSTSKVDQLERARAAFEPALIQELTRLDERMRSAATVLSTHLAPSAFFHMLEQTTITSLEYTSLQFASTDPVHMTIQMQGVAESVNSIALQADLFSKGGMLSSPIFSNINRQEDGVHFEVAAQVHSNAINFSQIVAAAGASPALVPGSQTPGNSPFGTQQPDLDPQVPTVGSPFEALPPAEGAAAEEDALQL